MINVLEMDVVDEIPLGDKAKAIAVDTDEHVIYVSYLTQNKIVKIDGQTNEILSTYGIQSNPWDIKVDPDSHNFYAALKSDDSILVFGPAFYSMHLPVLTLQIPTALVGMIHVHGNDVTVSNLIVDVVNNELKMNVGTDDGGRLSIDIPEYVLGSKLNDVNIPFEISIDDKIVEHKESKGIHDVRVVSFQVDPGSKILSISGSHISVESNDPVQTFGTPTQEPSLSKGYDIICEGRFGLKT